ncbi:MAG: nuclear transport factor 2 family protein [Nostocoides sp.]
MVADGSVVNRLYQAIADKDLGTAEACFASGAVWHLPGSSPISGDHVGWQQIRDDFLAKLGPLSEGTFRADLIDVAIGESYVVAVQHATANAHGKSLDITGCQLIGLDEAGLIAKVRGHYSDHAALDAFWID